MSRKAKAALETIDTRAADWREVIIVCGKCGDRLDGGFGDKRRQGLRRVLRDAAREGGLRGDVRVVETGCLGVCPKGAVVAWRGGAPERLVLVPPGQSGGEVLAALGVKPNRRP